MGSRIHLLLRWRLKECDPGTLPWRMNFVATKLVLVLGMDSVEVLLCVELDEGLRGGEGVIWWDMKMSKP